MTEKEQVEAMLKVWLEEHGWHGSEFNYMVPGPLSELILKERADAVAAEREIIACLTKALEWYAEEEHYIATLSRYGIALLADAEEDCGYRARRALHRLKELIE